jgi:hypothetical protein
MSEIGWVNEEPVSEVEIEGEFAVTDASVVGNGSVTVPLAFTDGAEATTALSVVGKSGGGLTAGAGELETSVDCASGFWGSAGVESFFSFAAC